MIKQLKSLFSREDRPRPLPVGLAELEALVERIMSKLDSGLKQVPKDDIKFIVTTNITHLKPQECEVRDSYFIRTIHAAASKQVAGRMFQQVKEDQKKRQEEAEKQLAEETAKNQAGTSECPPVSTTN